MTIIGQRFQGRYLVQSAVGQGGMQSVFQGVDELTGRPVAIKTPLMGQHVRRFTASARIAARVNHGAVAKTYDYFEEADIPYLVEEYVAGPDLETVFPEGKYIDPHGAARIFLSLAKGVSASHKAGVIHRDLRARSETKLSGISGLA